MCFVYLHPSNPFPPLFLVIYCKRLGLLRLGVSIHNNNNNNNNNFGSYENHTDTHRKTRDAFPFEAFRGRHRLFAVDVWRTLRKLDNLQEMADQTSCYRESNSVAFTLSGKR